jgi:hypothetical protein
MVLVLKRYQFAENLKVTDKEIVHHIAKIHLSLSGGILFLVTQLRSKILLVWV